MLKHYKNQLLNKNLFRRNANMANLFDYNF